jgi:hypothetical protein
MIHDVEQENRAIRYSVKASVECSEIHAVEVGHPVLLAKVGRDERLANEFSPLPINPKPQDAVPQAFPHGLGRLATLIGKVLPRLVRGLDVIVDDDLFGTKRHASSSEPSSMGQRAEQAWTGGVSPLYSLRSFDGQSEVETELQRPVQTGAAGCMP